VLLAFAASLNKAIARALLSQSSSATADEFNHD
jgi:hypothetical protein